VLSDWYPRPTRTTVEVARRNRSYTPSASEGPDGAFVIPPVEVERTMGVTLRESVVCFVRKTSGRGGLEAEFSWGEGSNWIVGTTRCGDGRVEGGGGVASSLLWLSKNMLRSAGSMSAESLVAGRDDSASTVKKRQ